MPTYDYECRACGEGFEKFQPITSSPVRKCPSCGERKAQRLIGAGAGILFRGSGFYETDYRSAEYKAKAKADKDSASTDSSSKKNESSGSDSTKTKAKAGKNGSKAGK